MGYLPPTPYLGLALADPATVQAFKTTDVNSWFNTIDTSMSAQNTRLVKVEQYTSGTTAQRDVYWGIPGTAADRVALAAKGPRWFNTDKGWEEQYFAGTADVGSGRFSRTAAGWYPSLTASRVPLKAPTVALGAGTSVIDGGIVRFTSATNVALDGIFTADFARYEIKICIDTASVAADVLFAGRTAGVTDSTSIWNFAATSTTVAGAITGSSSPAQSYAIVGRSGAGGGEVDIQVRDPSFTKMTRLLTRSSDADGIVRSGGAHRTPLTAVDGFLFSMGGGPTMNGSVQVFGINDY